MASGMWCVEEYIPLVTRLSSIVGGCVFFVRFLPFYFFSRVNGMLSEKCSRLSFFTAVHSNFAFLCSDYSKRCPWLVRVYRAVRGIPTLHDILCRFVQCFLFCSSLDFLPDEITNAARYSCVVLCIYRLAPPFSMLLFSVCS